MKSVSVHEGGGVWWVFFDGDTWRGWVLLEVSDGVPVVLDVRPVDGVQPPPVLRRHTKSRRRSGWGWSVVGELLEM